VANGRSPTAAVILHPGVAAVRARPKTTAESPLAEREHRGSRPRPSTALTLGLRCFRSVTGSRFGILVARCSRCSASGVARGRRPHRSPLHQRASRRGGGGPLRRPAVSDGAHRDPGRVAPPPTGPVSACWG